MAGIWTARTWTQKISDYFNIVHKNQKNPKKSKKWTLTKKQNKNLQKWKTRITNSLLSSINMSVSTTISTSSLHVQNQASLASKGTAKQRNYILNDVAALKKKIQHEKITKTIILTVTMWIGQA